MTDTQNREHILQFFDYSHLPPHLRAVSKPFCDLAHAMVNGDNRPDAGAVMMGPPLPRNPERTVALRKLLEAKDAAVRALLAKDVSDGTRPPKPSPDSLWDAFANKWVTPGAKSGPVINNVPVGS